MCVVGHNTNYKRAILLSVPVSHTHKLNTAWCVAAALTAALTLLLPIKQYSVGTKSKIPSRVSVLPLPLFPNNNHNNDDNVLR